MKVLFLCTGNSCRSILAEATFNHLAPAGWNAMSAGSHPSGQVHPRSLALLAREGIATTGLHSKSWDTLPLTPDIVITVCASAAGEVCPAYLGPVLRTHWGVDDPARARIGHRDQCCIYGGIIAFCASASRRSGAARTNSSTTARLKAEPTASARLAVTVF
jgi:protein-tyrosine-phosphatase